MATPFGVLTSTFASSVDGTLDTIPFWQSSTNQAYAITRNVFLNITGAPVGTTDTQTLTNKVITAPTISGPTLSGTVLGTYTLGGTPTFPAAVVTLTGTQALTNKTITSPAITGGTLDNATVTVDAVAGHTTANTGTVYGVSVTAGAISGASLTANTVPNTALQTGIQTSKFSNPYKFRGYLTAAQSLPAAFAKVAIDTKNFDTGSNLDIVTNKGRFTAPIAGFYQFNGAVACPSPGGTTVIVASLYKNGTEYTRGNQYGSTAASTQVNCTVSDLIQLAAGDYIELWGFCNGTIALATGAVQTYFSGFLVSAT